MGAILRDGAPAVLTDRLVLQLGPIEPVLLALSAVPLPAPTLSGPAQAALGEFVTFRLGLDAPAVAAAHVVRLEVFGPTGRRAGGVGHGASAVRRQAVASASCSRRHAWPMAGPRDGYSKRSGRSRDYQGKLNASCVNGTMLTSAVSIRPMVPRPAERTHCRSASVR